MHEKKRVVIGRYRRLAAILTLLLATFLMASCMDEKEDTLEYNLTRDEKSYIEGLAEFKVKDKEKMHRYMYIFIKHKNAKIPDEDLEFIKENTDEKFYEEWVKHQFIDESQIEIVEDMDEAEFEKELIKGGGSASRVPSWVEIPETSDLDIMRFYYFYKDSTYAAKAGDTYGYKYVFYFKVNDGKVSEIDEIH